MVKVYATGAITCLGLLMALWGFLLDSPTTSFPFICGGVATVLIGQLIFFLFYLREKHERKLQYLEERILLLHEVLRKR